MSAITQEMIEATYTAAKFVYAQETKKLDATKEVVQNTGMNHNSARGYISTVICMLKAKPYGRTIKAEAVDYFLSNIFTDYGIDKFSNAFDSVKVHLENNPNTQPNVRKVLKRHKERLS